MTRLHSSLLTALLLESLIAIPAIAIAIGVAAWRAVVLIEALRLYYLGDA